MAEFAISVPVLLVAFLGTVDMGRVVFAHQTLADLSRETANLVSRGTDITTAVNLVIKTSDRFDLDSDGFIIISRVTARSADDNTPWVAEQDSNGALTGIHSKIGTAGGAARLPVTKEMANGQRIMAVELVQSFEPVFPLARFGLDVLPTDIRATAYF